LGGRPVAGVPGGRFRQAGGVRYVALLMCLLKVLAERLCFSHTGQMYTVAVPTNFTIGENVAFDVFGCGWRTSGGTGIYSMSDMSE
jgi:hypothetical protein